jgi:ribonuclease P protein component, eubacterial
MINATSLKKNFEFKRIYFRGKAFQSSSLITYVFYTRYGGIKYGITTSKKIGNAVQRNRARRIIKQAFFELLPDLNDLNVHIIFVARSKTTKMKTKSIKNVMFSQLTKAGLT